MSNFYTDIIKKDSRYNSTNVIKDVMLLEPVTRAAVAAIIADAAKLGHDLRVGETYRSQARQTQVFKQGASKLSKVGCHGFGLAADLQMFVNGQYDTVGEHYAFLAELCKKHGLVSGIDWGRPNSPHTFRDWDHVQRCAISDQPGLFAGTWYPDDKYNPNP